MAGERLIAVVDGVFPSREKAPAWWPLAVNRMLEGIPIISSLVEVAELLGVSKQGAHQIAAEGGFHCPD